MSYSYAKERDEFLSIMGAEGVPVTVARTLLREASTLQRLAELECSSERADRDQVRCPAGRITATAKTACLCQDYGSFDDHTRSVDTCGRCQRSWCGKCDPGPSAACHYCEGRGRSTKRAVPGQIPRRSHGTIPRHMVQSAASVARVGKLCTAHGLTPHFGGDPRGCMLVITVPSGKTNAWDGQGIAVPSRGYTSAQLERIG